MQARTFSRRHPSAGLCLTGIVAALCAGSVVRADVQLVASIFGSTANSATTASGITLDSTSGQAVIGVVASSDGSVEQGFWYTGAASEPSSVPELEGVVPPVQVRFAGPNPFAAQTSITLELKAATLVDVVVHSASGQKVRSVNSSVLAGGRHTLSWDGRNDEGNRVGSGVYFLRVRADAILRTQKVVIRR